MLAAAVLIIFSIIAFAFVKILFWDIIIPLIKEARKYKWNKEKSYSVKVNWSIVALTAIFFFNLLIIYVIGSDTIISVFTLITIYVLISIPLLLLFFIVIIKMSLPSGPILLLTFTIIVPFILSLFLIVNYLTADAKIEKYQISRVYTEKGIGRFTPSKKLVILQDNALREFKSFRMFEHYEKINGSYVQFRFGEGCFGFKVLKERQITND